MMKQGILDLIFAKREPPEVVILDDNPLSITCYIEEYGNIFDDKKTWRHRQWMKLKRLLKRKTTK